MLAALDVEATALRAEFPEHIADPEFLVNLKGSYGIYATYDHKQKRRDAEARAIKESGLTALWFGPFWRPMRFWDQAKWLITRWETIDRFATSAVAGTCAEIKQNGKCQAFRLKQFSLERANAPANQNSLVELPSVRAGLGAATLRYDSSAISNPASLLAPPGLLGDPGWDRNRRQPGDQEQHPQHDH